MKSQLLILLLTCGVLSGCAVVYDGLQSRQQQQDRDAGLASDPIAQKRDAQSYEEYKKQREAHLKESTKKPIDN